MARKWKSKEDWAAAPTDQRIDEIFPERDLDPARTSATDWAVRSEKVRGGIRNRLQSQEYLDAKAAAAPWKPFLRDVPLGRDGMPENASLRAAVVELAMEKYVGSWGLKLVVKHLADKMSRNGRDLRLKKDLINFTAEEVLRSVVLAGRFKFDGKNFDFAPRKRKGKTEEEKLDNYEAIIRGVSERLCDDCGSQSLAGYLFRTWRNLYSPIVVETSRGRGMLIPSLTGVDGSIGAVVLEAFVVIAEPRGVVCYEAPQGSLTTRWRGYDPVVDVDVSKLVDDPVSSVDLAAARLNPSVAWDAAAARYNQVLRKAFLVSATSPWRAQAAAYVEEELHHSKWRGFVMSLSKIRMLTRVVRRVLHSVLEPEVRKAAGRDPFANYELYDWFAAGGGESRLRRLQASEAFPAATFMLPEFEQEIDEGRPLVQALMRRTGMSKSSVKTVRGLNWQKIGARNCKAVVSMGGVPKERVPTSKKDWDAVSKIVAPDAGGSPWVDHLPVEMRGRFMKAASSDWDAYGKLLDRQDFVHALVDTAAALSPLATGKISVRRSFDPAMFALLVDLVGGESFGVKRLRKFGHDWHAGTARRTAIQRTILKQAFGERLSTWNPLTDDLETEHGVMQWLVNEDDLAREGQEMRHCVGSYVSRCVQGTSHIASFIGADGTRSTAEFRLSGGRISPVQHQTYYNRSPTGDVVSVYEAFLKKYRAKKFEIARGVAGGEVTEGLVAEASEEVLESLRRTYADILPERCMSWS